MSDRVVCTKTFQLNNGTQIPAIGLGTWQGTPGSDDARALENIIVHALRSGYRHIDTAQAYGTESVVGRAIRTSGVPRREITVVTKFGGHLHHDPGEALRISLAELGLDYVDIFLMHWPWATTAGPERKPLRIHESPTFVETWKMMELLVGPTCRGIGVSNFSQKTLGELLANASVVPVVNQVELHALNPNFKLVSYCNSKGIHVTSWSTLGGQFGNAGNEILTHDLFTSIAKAHSCSTGVVSLSWAVQRGISVIPKSSSQSRIAENIKLVTLSDEEMDRINGAQDVIKKLRIADSIPALQVEIDGIQTLQGWTQVDYGWEDEQGKWLL